MIFSCYSILSYSIFFVFLKANEFSFSRPLNQFWHSLKASRIPLVMFHRLGSYGVIVQARHNGLHKRQINGQTCMTCVSKSHFLGLTLMALVHSQDYSNFTQKLSKLLNLFLINSVHQALGGKIHEKMCEQYYFYKEQQKKVVLSFTLHLLGAIVES